MQVLSMKEVCVAGTWHGWSDSGLEWAPPALRAQQGRWTHHGYWHVPHCWHRLCDLWRRDETPRCQDGERTVQPSTCGVCHTRSCQLWVFKMRPAGRLSVFNFFHMMWEPFKRLHSSLTKIVSGQVRRKCAGGQKDLCKKYISLRSLHKPNTIYYY